MNNLLIRILIAVIFIPFILYISYFGGIPFLSFICLLILLGLTEFSSILKLKHFSLLQTFLVLLGLMLGVSAYFFGERFLPLILLFGIVIPGAFQLVKHKFDKAIENLSSFVFGLIWVALFFSFLILIRELPREIGLEYHTAGFWVIFLFLCSWLSDILSYFVGAPFGKHKILPEVSPNKSWEGAIGGITGAVLGAALSKSLFLKEIPFIHLLVLSILVSVFGQLGDFVESSFKRQAGLKDSSSLIPGHGGILDRFDSLLFSAPLFYFYLRLILYK